MKIYYKGKDFVKIEKGILQTYNTVKPLFLIDVPGININIHEKRTDFNKKLKRETAEWLVGNASYNRNEINILSPIALENESSHKKSEFLQLLKHEFVHLFINKLAKGNAVPMWLNEGLASYVARQHKNYKRNIFIEKDFCKKLSTPKGWNDNINYLAYQISSLFVSFLIKKYSLNKIMELISSLDKNYYYPNFKEIFFNVYKKELGEVEKLFIKEINK